MYSKIDYNNLVYELKSFSNEKHSSFHSKLVPNIDKKIRVLGVPIPILRKMAKELIKSFMDKTDLEQYMSFVGNDYYEEIMLMGIVVGSFKCDFETKLKYISEFVPKISDWAVCDTFCSTIKIPNSKHSDYRKFLAPYLKMKGEFELRFAIVSLMQNYINDEYIDETIKVFESVNDDRYYVQMAIAWALSVCYVKYPQQTRVLFEKRKLSKQIQNKAIQKCRESLRVSKEDKQVLLEYKL